MAVGSAISIQTGRFLEILRILENSSDSDEFVGLLRSLRIPTNRSDSYEFVGFLIILRIPKNSSDSYELLRFLRILRIPKHFLSRFRFHFCSVLFRFVCSGGQTSGFSVSTFVSSLFL